MGWGTRPDKAMSNLRAIYLVCLSVPQCTHYSASTLQSNFSFPKRTAYKNLKTAWPRKLIALSHLDMGKCHTTLNKHPKQIFNWGTAVKSTEKTNFAWFTDTINGTRVFTDTQDRLRRTKIWLIVTSYDWTHSPSRASQKLISPSFPADTM